MWARNGLEVGVLGISGADAFVGDVIGVDLDGVTCTNTTKGTTTIGTTAPGGVYDCQPIPTVPGDLPTEPGDLVEITLSGTVAEGQLDCVDVMENPMPPPPPIIALFEGACFNLIGSIAIGFGDINTPTPGFETDVFALQSVDATAVRLSLDGTPNIQFAHLISDVEGNAQLTCILTPESCRGTILTSLTGIGVFASAPGSYVLQLRVIAVNQSNDVIRLTTASSGDLTAGVKDAVQRLIDR